MIYKGVLPEIVMANVIRGLLAGGHEAVFDIAELLAIVTLTQRYLQFTDVEQPAVPDAAARFAEELWATTHGTIKLRDPTHLGLLKRLGILT